MYVRLGFAVAIHTEPDVLLVDEVLAVGDVAFRQKCLQRIAEIRERDIAIIMVSHHMHLVNTVCGRVVVLQGGKVRFDGDTGTGVNVYRRAMFSDEQARRASNVSPLEITSLDLLKGGAPCSGIETNGPLGVRVHYRGNVNIDRPVLSVNIHTVDGVHCIGCRSNVDGFSVESIKPGHGSFELRFDKLNLLPGGYVVSAVIVESGGLAPLTRPGPTASFDVAGDKRMAGVCDFPRRWYFGASPTPDT